MDFFDEFLLGGEAGGTEANGTDGEAERGEGDDEQGDECPGGCVAVVRRDVAEGAVPNAGTTNSKSLSR